LTETQRSIAAQSEKKEGIGASLRTFSGRRGEEKGRRKIAETCWQKEKVRPAVWANGERRGRKIWRNYLLPILEGSKS